MQGLSGLLCAHLARWGSTTVGLCGLVMRQKLPTGRDKPLSLNFTYMHSARTLLAAQLDFRTTLLGCTAPTHTLPFPRHTHDHCCLHSGTRLLQQLHHSLATLNASPPPPAPPHRNSLATASYAASAACKAQGATLAHNKKCSCPHTWFTSACCVVLCSGASVHHRPRNPTPTRVIITCSLETHM